MPVSRKSNLVIQELENEVLIYDLSQNKAFSLNETSAIIWEACTGENSVSDIKKQINNQLNASVSEDFVWLALEQFKKDNLLENANDIFIDFGGLSRREVIRRIGLSSLAAIPIITTLVAPVAAQVASSACRAMPCRCNVGTSGCNGNSGSFGGITYVNCFSTASPNNPNCNCITDSGSTPNAGSGFRAGTCRIEIA